MYGSQQQGGDRHRQRAGTRLAYAHELARGGASVIVNDVDREAADAAVASIIESF